jgi:putative hydrolase of the HAD superfamily
VSPTTKARICAVTFDFWNTLFVEVADSIRPLRAAMVASCLSGFGHHFDPATVELGLDAAWIQHRSEWSRGRYYSAGQAAQWLLRHLEISDGRNRAMVAEVAEALSYMIAATALEPTEEILPVLTRLNDMGIRLGLISDTGFTPGRVLTSRLRELGLAGCFSGFTFSDVVGSSKPNPRLFEHALGYLDCAPSQVMHVGDLYRNDVIGARRAGWKTARYCRISDDHPPEGLPDADFVLSSHAEIFQVIGGSLFDR